VSILRDLLFTNIYVNLESRVDVGKHFFYRNKPTPLKMTITTKARITAMLVFTAPVAIAIAPASRNQAVTAQIDPASIQPAIHSAVNDMSSFQTALSSERQTPVIKNSTSDERAMIFLPVVTLRSAQS